MLSILMLKSRRLVSHSAIVLGTLCFTSAVGCNHGGFMKMNGADVSGAYYDWQVTRQPERPYIHAYHQTLVYKIFLAEKVNIEDCDVKLRFDEALDVIKRIDNLTRGIPKIVYLVGWQHNGHDSKYPDLSTVNHRLKRPEDATALDSLKWLMDEGYKYNTTVSLHINLYDAYPSSPLWDEYIEKDVIARGADGKPLFGETFSGETSYGISYTREWDEGLTQRRLDGFLAMVPIEKAGTLHVDAFHSKRPMSANSAEERAKYPNCELSPYHGITVEQESATQRKIFRYMRDKGIDITAECSLYWLRKDGFAGLQPMAWHFDGYDPMEMPASLYCGGGGGHPLFGVSMYGEDIINHDPVNLPGFLKQFCTQTLNWYFLNRLDRLSFEDNTATFSDGVISNEVGITQNGRLIYDRKSHDAFVSALWRESREIIAYSENGYTARTWQLPPEWHDVKQVTAQRITTSDISRATIIRVVDGTITLSLCADEALAIQPSR